MPIPTHQWIKGQTLSNGFCGYHSIAEAFVRVARNRPELINDEFFNAQNPIFRPTYDFLKHSLNIPGELTPGSLQAALLRDEVRFNGTYIAQRIAPAMFILALTHYRSAIAPARAEFIRQEPGLRFNVALDLAAELAMASLQQYDPFGGIEANRDIERAHYVEYLSIAIYNWEEEHALLQENARIPLVARFLNSAENMLTPETADEFMNLVYLQGLNYAQLPTISIFDNLCRLMFRPIAIEADNGVAAPIPYYPVSVVSEAFLSLPHHPAPDEVIAAVYRCSAGAHFQYAIPPLCVQTFHENVSNFNPAQRVISGLSSHRTPLSSKKNNKTHRAILQKQALAKVRAEKHAKFMQQLATQVENVELTDLQQQIQLIQSQIQSSEINSEKNCSKKHRKKSNKSGATLHPVEIQKLKERLSVLKQEEALLEKKTKPISFSAQQAQSELNFSREREELEKEIKRLTASNHKNKNQAQIELAQFQLKQLRLIEKEISEQKSMGAAIGQSTNFATAPKPVLRNSIFPQDAGPLGRIVNYFIEKLIDFLMRALDTFTGNPRPGNNRFAV